MLNIFYLLKDSAKELKNVRTLAISAMLAAINTVLGLSSIMIGDFVKIGFSFLATGLAGILYGPITAGILGGLGDILNYLVKPAGPFFPGFTLSAVLSGFIYGFFLYKKPVSIRRIFFARLIIVIFIDLALSTIWLSLLSGKAFFILLPMRTLKAAIMLPVETGILYIVSLRITALEILQKR